MKTYRPGAMLGGVRKAFASKGDDATFSRFVKVKAGEIGFAVATVKRLFDNRFAIRWSNNASEDEWSTRTTVEPFTASDAFQCPEQVGLVDGCGKCGLCWNTKKNVAFISH